MNEFNTGSEQSAVRTRIDDLPTVGEELAPEQLQLVVGGMARISGPTCCSTCSCDYSDEGCGC